MRLARDSLCAALASVLALGAALPPQDDPFDEGERLFALEVQPLLLARCISCHGEKPGRLKSGLDLSTRAGALRGGEYSERVIVPGDAEGSLLLTAIRRVDPDLQMPPKDNDRLTLVQIDTVRRWIEAGAPWPDAERQAAIVRAERRKPVTEAGRLVETSGGLDEAWTYRRYRDEDLWAFRRLTQPGVPDDGHPIDAFVLRKLAARGFAPAPAADRRTLIRRATYDLIGLPPAPAEIDAFIADESPHAWENLIERLLRSPHYGEQWGRHWLDVARYADTAGYSNDWERSNAWRYRDYVIRSFNDDKPYDEFVVEQLAGDELRPEDAEMKVAVGFLRMGPWEHTEMAVAKETRQLWLDDVTNSVGETFLSTPMRCFRCHDHKFDPLPTHDYYRFQAAFAATQLAELPAPFIERESQRGFGAGTARIEKLARWAKDDVQAIHAKEDEAARAWCENSGIPFVSRRAKKASSIPEDEKPPRHIGLDYHDQGFLKVRRQDAKIWTRRLERYRPLAQSVYNGPAVTMSSKRLRRHEAVEDETPPKTFILGGGSVHAPQNAVAPGVLSAFPIDAETEPAMVPSSVQGRRLALGRWIASPDNALAMRSIVNRVWHYHFGKGLAANANNFGKTGARPTHPELLDWLAARFIDDGFSIKALHRRIMTSATYRQSGRHPASEELREQDPDNELLAYFAPRRLAAEELRDTMLAVSGELQRDVGGLPVRPEINMDVALQPRKLQGSLAPVYQPSRTPTERNRRSIYIYRMRGQADPILEVFNQPGTDASCEARDVLITTPQVFALMNSAAVTDRSIAMAVRIEGMAEDWPTRVEYAVRDAFGRVPTDSEKTLLVEYVREMIDYHRDVWPETIPLPGRIERSVVEEMSGLAFDYVERLDVYEDYVPDAKPWGVGVETRALADLCMVLFNANEFVYVY